MRSQLGLAFCLLLCVSACGGNAGLTQSSEIGGSAGVGASNTVAVGSTAGAISTGAGGTDSSAAGGSSAGAASAGEAGTAPIENTSCADAPAVVGCGCPQDPGPPPEVWSCIECDTLPSTSALIGPEGGSFTLRGEDDKWFVLTIPPNALARRR